MSVHRLVVVGMTSPLSRDPRAALLTSQVAVKLTCGLGDLRAVFRSRDLSIIDFSYYSGS